MYRYLIHIIHIIIHNIFKYNRYEVKFERPLMNYLKTNARLNTIRFMYKYLNFCFNEIDQY